MFSKVLCFCGVAACQVSVGIAFYKYRVEDPHGWMRHDSVAFFLPLLLAVFGNYLIFHCFSVLPRVTFTRRIVLLGFCSLAIACVFQVLAMTVSANLYGT